MRRRVIEFFLFFFLGLFLAAALEFSHSNQSSPRLLADIKSVIPVFATDTAVMYDTNHLPVGKLYPSGGVVYLEKPLTVDSGRILIRIYGWIYYENIFNLGKEWLLIQDENIRVKNNCVIIGRVAKNTRLQRIYSPEDRQWNLVSLDCFVKIRYLRSYVDSRYQPIFKPKWPYVVTTDLTKEGCKYPPRYELIKISLPEFFAIFPMVGMFALVWFYFRNSGRLHCSGRWVLLVIDIVGFSAGVALQLIL